MWNKSSFNSIFDLNFTKVFVHNTNLLGTSWLVIPVLHIVGINTSNLSELMIMQM